MAWFDRYESLSKRNKWRKMATDSEKRIEAKRLVREQEAKDKKKLEDDTRREALQTRLQWFRENERVPAKKEQTVTPTPSRRDPTSLVDYSQPPTSIMGGFPRDDPDYYGGGKFRAEQIEDSRREKEEEKTRKQASFRNIDAELARRQAVKDFVTAADILDYSSAASAAYRMILAPNSTIPISAFDNVPETRDFVMDVRGGNYDRVSELEQPGNKIGSDLLNQMRFSWSSKLEEPEGVPEGLSFAPKLSEIVDYDASDLGKFYKGDDVIVGDEARAFFIPDEAEREAALLNMPWEEQIQFSLQWVFELQEDKIIGGKFNELTPVPGLGKLYEDSLLLLADTAINERRILTEEERALAEFFSLAAGFPDISLTQEQKDTLAQILRDEEKIAVEAGTFEGESDYVNFLERLSKPSELGIEEIPMSEEALLIHSPMAQLEAQIREEQDFIRGNIPLSDFERMTKIHPVGIVIANMIRAFEEGYHHISKPLYEKYIGPTLATTGGATYEAIETGISLPAIAGVPLAPDVRGTVSDTYRNTVTSETANVVGGELLNPMNVTFVVPFIGPGSRFMKAYQAGNRLLAVQILADEFMFTGRTPEIAGYFARQGTRGLAAVSKMGLRSTLKRWPELRGNNVFIRMMSGVKRAGKETLLPWLDEPARAQARRELLETISRTNLAAANKNKILRLLRARQAGMNVTYSLNEFDPSLIKQTILENNLLVEESSTGAVRAYPYIGTGLPGQEETVRLLREGTVDEIISRAEDTAIQIEKGFTPVERGINNEISRLGTVIDELSGNTTKMATKKGRLERTVALRELIEVIAYRVGRGIDNLSDNLVLKTEQLYDEMDILVEGNNGLLSPTGRFYDLGDETPTQAARNIWDKTVEGIDDLPNEIGGTEGDILSGIITRFSDEVGIIGITRVGDNKLIIEATTDITKQQIDQIRRIIREENIKDIDFSFDTVHGIRTNERQILYRGAPDEKFDDILNKTQKIKTSKIAERLRGLEDAAPIEEGVGVLPPGFKVLPDPDMVDLLVRTFKTYNVGEIPPPGLGFVLQDGRIVYLGDNMQETHAFVLRLVADQTSSPSEAIQLVLNNIGAIKYNSSDVGFITINLYRPIIKRQRRGLIALLDSGFEKTEIEFVVGTYDGAKLTDEVLSEVTILNEQQLRTALRGIRDNPPKEWDSIINALKQLDTNLDDGIRQTKNEVLRGEGILPDVDDSARIVNGEFVGEEVTVVEIRNNSITVSFDNRPGEVDLPIEFVRFSDEAVDVTEGIPRGVDVTLTVRDEPVKPIADLTEDEFIRILLGEEAFVSPLTDDAVELLKQFDEGDKTLGSVTNNEVAGIRGMAADNGLLLPKDATVSSIIDALRNKRASMESLAVTDAKLSKQIDEARVIRDKAQIEMRVARGGADAESTLKNLQDLDEKYRKLVKKADEAKRVKKISDISGEEKIKLLDEAAKNRNEARKIITNLVDESGKAPPQKKINTVMKLFARADELETQAGIPRTVSSMVGEITNADIEVKRIKQVLADNKIAEKGEKLSKKVRQALENELKFLEDQLKKNTNIKESAVKRINKLEKDIGNLERKKSLSPKQKEKLIRFKKELEYEKLSLIEGLSDKTPLEQVKHLENKRVEAVRMAESNLSEKARMGWRERQNKITKAINYIEGAATSEALAQEQQRMYADLIKQGMEQRGGEVKHLESQLKSTNRKIKKLIENKNYGPDSGGQLSDLYLEQIEHMKGLSEIRADVQDAVQVLTQPLEGSSRYWNIDDMIPLFAARGYRGNVLEKFMAAKYKISGVKQLMRTVRTGPNLFDPSFALGSDFKGQLVLANAKMRNIAIMESTEDAHKLAATPDPFKIDKNGFSIITGRQVGDMAENWKLYKDQFGVVEDEYVQLLLNIRRRGMDFVKAQGIKNPEIWDEIDRVFREVLHKVGKDKGKIDLTDIRDRISGSVKPSIFKQRAYETMLDGYLHGIVYEANAGKVMLDKVTALRKWAVDEAFLRKVSDNIGYLKDSFIAEELKLADELAKVRTSWADSLFNYTRGSYGGQPKKQILRDSLKWGEDVPEELKTLRDQIDDINKNVKLTPAEKKKLIGTQSRKLKGGSTKKATGIMERVERIRNEYRALSQNSGNELAKIKRNLKSAPLSKIIEGEEVAVRAAPQYWSGMGDSLFRTEDIAYLEKHWGDKTNWAVTAGKEGAKVVSRARILQTGLDLGGWLVNTSLLFGHDVARGTIGAVTLQQAKGGDIRAFPAVSPILDLFQKGMKSTLGIDQTLIRGESAWGKAAWNSLTALGSQKASSKWWLSEVAKNPEKWARFKKHARIAGLPHEFGEFGFFEKAESVLPGLKQLAPFARFQRSFTQTLSGAAWLYWKSLDDLASTADEYEQLGRMARNIVGVHAGQELGIHAGQLGIERLMFYAPSFQRAGFAIMANAMFQPNTFAGRQALKSIAGLAGSMSMIVFAYSMTKELEKNGYDFNKLDWDSLKSAGSDVVAAWNPGSGQFWGMRVGNAVVGLGGAMRSNMGLIGRLIAAGVEWEPTRDEPLNGFKLKPLELIPDDWNHPFARWWRGKGSIPVNYGWNIISDKDFLGYTVDGPFDLSHLQQLAPFWLNAALESRMGLTESIGFGVGEFMGGRIYPVPLSTLMREDIEDATGLTPEEQQEMIPGPTGRDTRKHSRILTAIERNEEPPEEYDRDAWDKAHESYKNWEEDRRKKGSEYQAADDITERDTISAHREIADLMISIDGSAGSGVERTKQINNIYTTLAGKNEKTYEMIFGVDGGAEILDNEDIRELDIEAQLIWAYDLENYRDEVTDKVDYDARREMIDSLVAKLPPLTRDFYERNEAPIIGMYDVENFQNGMYDDANEALLRKKRASDAYEEMDNAPKYKGLTKEEGEKVGDLLDMVSMVRSIFQLQGRSMDRRDILRNLLNLFPSNRIVSVALISTYPGLAPIIETGERERIMMENPDLMVFWPYLMNYGFSEDFREEWGARWGMGQNVWPGSGAIKLSEKLAALEEEEGEDDEDGGLWNFGTRMLGL